MCGKGQANVETEHLKSTTGYTACCTRVQQEAVAAELSCKKSEPHFPPLPLLFSSLHPMQAGFVCASSASSQASSVRGIQKQPQSCKYELSWKSCHDCWTRQWSKLVALNGHKGQLSLSPRVKRFSLSPRVFILLVFGDIGSVLWDLACLLDFWFLHAPCWTCFQSWFWFSL